MKLRHQCCWKPCLFSMLLTCLLTCLLASMGWANNAVLVTDPMKTEKPLKFKENSIDATHINFTIENSGGRFDVGPFLYFYEDVDMAHNITTISQPSTLRQFKRNEQGVLSFGYVDTVYWFKLSIQNKTDINSNWLLELTGMGRSIDKVEAFIGKGGEFLNYMSGDAVPFSVRPLRHHAVLFPINMRAESITTIYLKVTTNGALQMPVVLWSESMFAEKEHNDTLLDGMFYGILFIMVMYNAFIFLSIRDVSYFYYVFYLLSVAFFAMSLRGIGYEYFWPELPWWNNKSNLFFAELTVMFVVLFAKSFMQTPRFLPVINRCLNVLLLSLVPGVCLVLYGGHQYSAGLVSVQFLAAIVLVLCAAVKVYKLGLKSARLYLLAWVGMLTMIILWIMNNFHLFSSGFLGAYAIQMGAVIQVLMFSFALAERINLMKKERELALKQRLIETQKLTAMTNTFERFVPRQFLTRVADKGLQNIELGKAETDIITILFSDIRGFTHLSEGMSPQELLNFLNAYFNRMDRPIHQSGGFIDKFVGDAILAIFESNHYEEEANNAVTAAIEMQFALRKYNEHRAKSGYVPIDIGVGINTGPVIIGTVGTQDRMDTTVLGDVVNLASRLEKLTKKYQAKIICSSYTLDLLDNQLGTLVRELDYVKVRGKQKAVRIYEIFNADEDNVRILKQRLLLDYQMGMNCYYERQWEQALDYFKACLELFPGDVPSRLYLTRCKDYLIKPPAEDWDFTWQLDD